MYRIMKMTEDVAGTLRAARRAAPGAIAVVSIREGVSATYQEVDERSDRIANGLLALGLDPGDRIAVWLETSLCHVLLYLAAAKAGLVVVPINERYVATEAAHILEDSGARALIFGTAAAQSVEDLDLGGSVMLLAAGVPTRGSRALSVLEQESSRPGAPVTRHQPEDPFILGYTSGTTGRPKGAVLSHRGVVNIARTNAIAYRLPMGSIGAYTASMSYTATVPAFILTHFYLAGTVVLCPTRDPDTVVDLIARHRANYTHIPPPLVDGYAHAFLQRRDAIRSLSSVLQGGGKVAARRLVPLNEALGGRLILGWGMTENSGGLATATTPTDTRRALDGDEAVLDSVGRVVPGSEIEIVDDHGQPLPADGGTVGELVLRSPSLMNGYWNPSPSRPDPFRLGWFHTGDLGTIDPDGLVHIRDRRDDLIVSGGLNVYPREVEDTLNELPGVRDCAVVGVDDDRWGQTVAAYIVQGEGAQLTETEIQAHCRRKLASYKKPTRVAFGASIPRTHNGKLKRFEVTSYFRT